MKGADSLYNSEYCEKNKNKKWRYRVTPELVEILYKHFMPKSVIDFGCANGLHIATFEKLGAETFGIEGTLYYRDYIKGNYSGEFAIIDLRMRFDIMRRFELATCIEVLEHLEEGSADTAVENIVRHADVFCITASPTETARFHINAKPKEYWVNKFESAGAGYQNAETNQLQDKFKTIGRMPIWMKEDLMIFRR